MGIAVGAFAFGLWYGYLAVTGSHMTVGWGPIAALHVWVGALAVHCAWGRS